MATRSKLKSKFRNPRIRGICKAAAALGCTREHLRRVLNGQRGSSVLLARYHDFVKAKNSRNKRRSTSKPLEPDQSPIMAYIGRKSCGCVVAACIDDKSHPEDTAEDLARFVKSGYAVERVTSERASQMIGKCKCGK